MTCWVPECPHPALVYGVCARHREDEKRAEDRHEYLRGLELDDLNPQRVVEREREAAERAEADRRALLAHLPTAKWTGDGSRYGCAAITGILRDLPAHAADAGRNNALNRAAFIVGQLVAGGELETGKAWRTLHDAGLALGLPQREVHAAVKSGFHKGLDNPKPAPQRVTQRAA